MNYLEYWSDLIANLRSTGYKFRPNKHGERDYLIFRSPLQRFRCGFELSVRDKEIWVWLGSSTPSEVEFLRRIQQEKKAEFEQDLSEKNVDWEDKKERGRFWISPCLQADPTDVSDWLRQHEWMKRALEKLIAAVSKHLDEAAADNK